MMAKKACPICVQANKLMATGNEKDYKKAKKFQPRRRIYMNVIVRGQESDGPKVWAFGVMIEEQLYEIRKDPEEGGPYTNPVKGFDLIVRRKGTGQNDTEYTITPSTKRPSPLHEDAAQMNEWIESQPTHDRYMTILTPAQIEAKLRGEEIEEDEEEEAPRKSRKSRNIEDEVEDAIDIEI